MANGIKTGGRKIGTPNKLTADARTAVAMAADALGGSDRLVAWAKEDPANERAFWVSVYPKLIPAQMRLSAGVAVAPAEMSAEQAERVARAVLARICEDES